MYSPSLSIVTVNIGHSSLHSSASAGGSQPPESSGPASTRAGVPVSCLVKFAGDLCADSVGESQLDIVFPHDAGVSHLLHSLVRNVGLAEAGGGASWSEMTSKKPVDAGVELRGQPPRTCKGR